MTRKTFALNTEPHEVAIGDTVLWFRPESNGAEFLGSYTKLNAVQTRHADSEDEIGAATEILAAMTQFVSEFLEPQSVPVFAALDVPFRIIQGLVEHLAELYGAGSQERPTTSSSGSARRSGNPGKRG